MILLGLMVRVSPIGRNILRFFKRLDQGRFVQGLGLLDALRYEIDIGVSPEEQK